MAELKKNILQAIADFDTIEEKIESYGVDVPYDTDTADYGAAIDAVYAKGAAQATKSVYNAETHYDFPSVGDKDVIYKAQSEKLIYQWNPTDLKYEVLGPAGGSENENIESITNEEIEVMMNG